MCNYAWICVDCKCEPEVEGHLSRIRHKKFFEPCNLRLQVFQQVFLALLNYFFFLHLTCCPGHPWLGQRGLPLLPWVSVRCSPQNLQVSCWSSGSLSTINRILSSYKHSLREAFGPPWEALCWMEVANLIDCSWPMKGKGSCWVDTLMCRTILPRTLDFNGFHRCRHSPIIVG